LGWDGLNAGAGYYEQQRKRDAKRNPSVRVQGAANRCRTPRGRDRSPDDGDPRTKKEEEDIRSDEFEMNGVILESRREFATAITNGCLRTLRRGRGKAHVSPYTAGQEKAGRGARTYTSEIVRC